MKPLMQETFFWQRGIGKKVSYSEAILSYHEAKVSYCETTVDTALKIQIYEKDFSYKNYLGK